MRYSAEYIIPDMPKPKQIENTSTLLQSSLVKSIYFKNEIISVSVSKTLFSLELINFYLYAIYVPFFIFKMEK